MLTVIIGSRHITISFSYRDANCNRVCVYFPQEYEEIFREYQDDNPGLDLDDCNAEEFMSFLRWIDNGM